MSIDWPQPLQNRILKLLAPLKDERLQDSITNAPKLRSWLDQLLPDLNTENTDYGSNAWAMFYVCNLLAEEQRNVDALSLAQASYNHAIRTQLHRRKWLMKGVVLYNISLRYFHMGFPVHAKRYMMLSLIEDTRFFDGVVDKQGTYDALASIFHVPHAKLNQYIAQIEKLVIGDAEDFPESILLQLDDEWMTEYPSSGEALSHDVNREFIRFILSKPDADGKNLELLAQYLLSCMPGCRTRKRAKSNDVEHDIVCSLDGVELDFRSEFGRYFVAECKDWSDACDVTVVAKFSHNLQTIGARFGILFSTSGITGGDGKKAAGRLLQKTYQRVGLVIAVIDKSDLDSVVGGSNFIEILRDKYEQIRLDIPEKSCNSKSIVVP